MYNQGHLLSHERLRAQIPAFSWTDEEPEPVLIVSHVNALCSSRLLLTGEGHILPLCVQVTSFSSLSLLEVIHAKFRTYQTKTQNSGWFMNARVTVCVLPRCFLPREPLVCLPVIVLYWFLSSNVGVFKVGWTLKKACTILVVSASVQRDGCLSNLI